MRKRNRIPANPELSQLPDDNTVISEVRREAMSVTKLFTRALEGNESLALDIRRKAHHEAGDDLAVTENLTREALEAIEIEKRRLTIEGLNRLFNGPSM